MYETQIWDTFHENTGHAARIWDQTCKSGTKVAFLRWFLIFIFQKCRHELIVNIENGAKC